MSQKEETLTPVQDGIAVHEDGDHRCIVQYASVPEGHDLRTVDAWLPRGDGSYERLNKTAGSIHGPAQVATSEYRESWERTFNSKGGVA